LILGKLGELGVDVAADATQTIGPSSACTASGSANEKAFDLRMF
jgi:hypothetical protein